MTDRDHSETRLRIVGDGTPGGTHVETSHGQRIKGVTAVRWSMAVGEARGALQVEVADCEVDVDTIRRNET